MMKSSLQLFSVLLILFTCHSASFVSGDSCDFSFFREHGRCILYGPCEESPYIPGGHVDCFDNIPAKDVSTMGTDFKNLLQEVCPQYITSGHVCCDHTRLSELALRIKYARQIFSRCPACLKNYLSHWCTVHCDPDQSMFMTPVTCEVVMVPDAARWAVTEVAVYVDRKYAEGLYRSCSQVQYPQGDVRVVDIMCGGVKQCNASAWLNFLGDPKENHNYPFLVDPLIMDPPYPRATWPIIGKVIPCDTVDPKDACECRDCYPPQLCPSPQPHVLNRSYTVTLRAKESVYTVFQPSGVYGVRNWTFGPVFTSKVLLEAYAIQDHLVNMVAHETLSDGTNTSVSLSDICYQPMAPINTNCSIISILNYFQNNRTRIQHTETFGLINSSYHIHYCTRNPTATTSLYFHEDNISCLGAFGGAIYPELALKGYNDVNGFPNYNNATKLVISFVVKDAPSVHEAVWKEAVLDYVRNYHGTSVEITSGDI